MANGEQRRTADGKCRMLHGRWRMANWQHSPALSLCLSVSPFRTELVHFVPALLFFALFLLLLFGALAAHAPTRLASVGFSPRFPFAHFPFHPPLYLTTLPPSLLPFPYAICVLPFTFFVAFFVGIFCARWPKVNPWAVAFLSNFYRSTGGGKGSVGTARVEGVPVCVCVCDRKKSAARNFKVVTWPTTMTSPPTRSADAVSIRLPLDAYHAPFPPAAAVRVSLNWRREQARKTGTDWWRWWRTDGRGWACSGLNELQGGSESHWAARLDSNSTRLDTKLDSISDKICKDQTTNSHPWVHNHFDTGYSLLPVHRVHADED